MAKRYIKMEYQKYSNDLKKSQEMVTEFENWIETEMKFYHLQ